MGKYSHIYMNGNEKERPYKFNEGLKEGLRERERDLGLYWGGNLMT